MCISDAVEKILEVIFQFLLGCFIMFKILKVKKQITFFQFLLGCFIIFTLDGCDIESAFQFLLGCFGVGTGQAIETDAPAFNSF